MLPSGEPCNECLVGQPIALRKTHIHYRCSLMAEAERKHLSISRPAVYIKSTMAVSLVPPLHLEEAGPNP